MEVEAKEVGNKMSGKYMGCIENRERVLKRKQCNFSRKTRLREALDIEQNLCVSLLAAKTKREIVVLGTLRDKPEVISSTGTFFNFILPSSHF